VERNLEKAVELLESAVQAGVEAAQAELQRAREMLQEQRQQVLLHAQQAAAADPVGHAIVRMTACSFVLSGCFVGSIAIDLWCFIAW
jgi:hypothetical protein